MDNVGLLNGDRHRLCFSSRETAQDTFYQTIWQGQVLYQALDTEDTTPYIFNWSCKHDYMQGLRRSLVYRPLLAFFLAMHFILDGWASLISEVSFSLICFLRILTHNPDRLVDCGLCMGHMVHNYKPLLSSSFRGRDRGFQH